MEQQEYDELVRRLVAVSEQHEKTLAGINSTLRHLDERQDDLERLSTRMDERQTAFERLLTKMDARQDDLAARQQVHEDIMKSLAATLVKQDAINDNQQRINDRLSTSLERLEGILVGIRDILRRGNGRTEG